MQLQEVIKDMPYTDMVNLTRILGFALSNRCSFGEAYTTTKLWISCIHDTSTGDLSENIDYLINPRDLANCLVMASLQVYLISDARQKTESVMEFIDRKLK